ncbi:MAG TPA: L-threonylcarbamoyladenylate synthase [Cyclobacteriaceae bacterium]|nr:L-threonylcarbamoyladenylate synthase [Cyclobacteriaceae bacterium]
MIGKDINKAIALLEAGELVAIPTETVYGLAGNALDTTAITKIFVAKNRPYFDPLIVHVPSLQRAEQVVRSIPEKALILSNLFWPGPLTILLDKKQIIPDLVTAGLDTVGIRCPRHPLTLELLQKINFPLAAPSANPFGYVSPTRPEHVSEQLGDKISYILDGGPCPIGIESTIVGFEDDQTIVYRLGGLSLESIEDAIGGVSVQGHSSANPKAPGQLNSHYAPRKQLVLGTFPQLFKTYGQVQVGTLSFKTLFQEVEKRNQIVLSPSGNLEEAARNLFSGLRELDKMEVSIILAEEVPDIGIGKAINDRLRRAAAQA